MACTDNKSPTHFRETATSVMLFCGLLVYRSTFSEHSYTLDFKKVTCKNCLQKIKSLTK